MAGADGLSISLCIGDLCYPPFLDTIADIELESLTREEIKLTVTNENFDGASIHALEILDTEKNLRSTYAFLIGTEGKITPILSNNISQKKDFAIKLSSNKLWLNLGSGFATVSLFNIKGQKMATLYSADLPKNGELTLTIPHMAYQVGFVLIEKNNKSFAYPIFRGKQ